MRFSASTVLAAIVLLGGTAPARADRPGIESVLQAMQQAVLAGDQAAYLRHVSTEDPVFLVEQRNWAADLARQRPVEFALRIAPPASPSAPEADRPADAAAFDDTSARFDLTMVWRMAADGPERTLTTPVSFRLHEGRWCFEGERWASIDVPADQATGFAGARVQFEPGLEATAKAVAEQLPAVRREVDALFGQRIDRIQPIKLYASMKHLQASIYLSYTDALSGWNEPGEAVKILVSRRPSGLGALLAHEYGHVATFELGAKASDAPWWVLEGIAERSAWPFRAGRAKELDRRIVQWASDSNLAEWAALSDFRSVEARWRGHVYAQGEHMIAYITQRFGDARRTDWLRALARGESLEHASTGALGIAFAALDADWRAHVQGLLHASKGAAPEQAPAP
jgi:hypothetical protein